jgi:hypothetical protein
MYLILDCETNGLARDWNAPVTNLSNWPRAIQLAWASYDTEHRELLTAVYFIRKRPRNRLLLPGRPQRSGIDILGQKIRVFFGGPR